MINFVIHFNVRLVLNLYVCASSGFCFISDGGAQLMDFGGRGGDAEEECLFFKYNEDYYMDDDNDDDGDGDDDDMDEEDEDEEEEDDDEDDDGLTSFELDEEAMTWINVSEECLYA